VIGGIDPGFKLKLYHALRAMDDAGLMPGIIPNLLDADSAGIPEAANM
jgi:hypothetical protein